VFEVWSAQLRGFANLSIGLAVARRIVGGACKWHVDEMPITGFGPLAAFVVGPVGDGAERMTLAEQARDRRWETQKPGRGGRGFVGLLSAS
jgi:hypothetical protein